MKWFKQLTTNVAGQNILGGRQVFWFSFAFCTHQFDVQSFLEMISAMKKGSLTDSFAG